jgi:hypothetical protein
MNQYNQNKTNPETQAKFERGMNFYVPIDVILVELDSSSDNMRIDFSNVLDEEKGLESCDLATDRALAHKLREASLEKVCGET